MHDPEVVVFSVRYPWKRRVSKDFSYHPAMVNIWHYEPGGRDALSICKGMGSSELSWKNLKFAARHIKHLRAQVIPYQRVHQWLFDRCAECGHRFLWKQGRTGYMSSDDVLHFPCMNLSTVRMQLDDLTKYITYGSVNDMSKEAKELLGFDDQNALWRAEYRLKNLAPQSQAKGERP